MIKFEGNRDIVDVNFEGTTPIKSVWASTADGLKRVWEKELPFTQHRWLCKNKDNNGLVNINQSISDKYISLRFREPLGLWSEILGVGNAEKYIIIRRDEYGIEINSKHSYPDRDINTFVGQGGSYSINDVAMTTNFNDNSNVSFFSAFYNQVRGVDKSVWIAKFTLGDTTLTPSRLTRPLLPSEDANGKTRVAGECGFADIAKYYAGEAWFYGNVASSGSFSVSDYLIEGEDFERIAGVVGTDETCINLPIRKAADTNILFDNFSISVADNEIPEVLVFNEDVGQKASVAVSYNNNVGWYNNSTEKYYVVDGKGINTWNVTKTSISINDIIIDMINTKLYITYWNVMSHFKVPTTNLMYDSINLIPVRLLRAISADCTHNNKGGAAGEIGFFDTISGKFYGNDGSGKFSRYLAEGTDYEVVAGVCASQGQYVNIRALFNRLYCHVVKGYDIIYPRIGYSKIVHTMGVSNDGYGFITNIETGTTIVSTQTGAEITISNGVLNVNELSVETSASYLDALFKTQIGQQVVCTSLQIDDNINLIPCKLLKSVTADDTHNNKGGSVGEIGFFDTISGKFYGNDGSGAFSEYVPE